MSRSANKLISAAAGAGGDPVYVDDVFSTFLYEGNGNGSGQTITNGIDLDGEGGMVWIKNRASGGSYTNHALVDSARVNSSTYHKSIYSNLTESEYNPGSSVSSAVATSFNSNGFSLGNNSNVNFSNGDYVSWTFRKQPGFFDVVTYTPSGSPTNVSHNLGSTPGMIIIKNLTDYRDWAVWHRSLSSVSGGESGGSQSTLKLNNGNAISGTGYIQSPTSTQFTVSGSSETGSSGKNYVAYLFAHDAQDFGTDEDEAIIKCGYYTGNGSSTGPSINLGFEPQWVLIKSATSSQEWFILDSMRGVVTGGNDAYLQADTSSAEGSYNILEFTSTGFNITTTSGWANSSSQDYIYMAIRRPHKPASEFAATDLFKADFAGSSGIFTGDAGFPVDFVIYTTTTGSSNYAYSRITGAGYLVTNTTAAETGSGGLWDSMTNFRFNGSGDYSTWINWLFRRAPGFFDVVAYDGTGSAHNISHNLGVAPELMILRQRDGVGNWLVYSKPTTAQKYSFLHTTQAFVDDSDSPLYFDDTEPTSTTFRVGTGLAVNQNNQEHIAYLFASVGGISKVGSYSGATSDVDVDCGFSAGARFVLIKRADSTGDWYLWDSVRGIAAGNDPYLLLNSTAAEVTNTDYIDPLNAGFTVASTAPAALNTSGGTYVFLAIA